MKCLVAKMNNAKLNGRKPVLQSLLVADNVYQDRVTGKYVVAGIFNSMQFAKLSKPKEEDCDHPTKIEETSASINILHNFPQWHKSGTPFVYINLTEVLGEQTFSLRYVSLEDNKVHFDINFKIECNDPLRNINVAIPIPSLPEESGIFAVELLWYDKELLGSMRMTVQEVTSKA